MSTDFPGPDATYSEITAWYAAHKMARPSVEPNEHAKDMTEWTDFDGATCTRPCKGWDGKSYRCDCQNNRVCWYEDGNDKWAGIC